MRFLTTIFMILFFLGTNAFANPSSVVCLHSDKAHSEEMQMSSDHSCCDDAVEKNDSKRSSNYETNNCKTQDCMVSIPTTSTPLLTTTILTLKGEFPGLAMAAVGVANFSLASLSSKILPLVGSSPDLLYPKVPLYIYYQKLLIP